MSIMRAVTAALQAEGLTPDAARVIAERIPDGDGGSVQQLIIDAARAMTDAGLAPRPVQVRVFWRAFGAGIGGGGGAGFFGGQEVAEPCPWCDGTGSHGGFCPGPYLGAGPGPHISVAGTGG